MNRREILALGGFSVAATLTQRYSSAEPHEANLGKSPGDLPVEMPDWADQAWWQEISKTNAWLWDNHQRLCRLREAVTLPYVKPFSLMRPQDPSMVAALFNLGVKHWYSDAAALEGTLSWGVDDVPLYVIYEVPTRLWYSWTTGTVVLYRKRLLNSVQRTHKNYEEMRILATQDRLLKGHGSTHDRSQPT